MTTEADRTIKRYNETKDPVEKAHLKKQIDQMPMSSGELEQVQQREADRKTADIKEFHEKRKQ